MTAPAGEAGTSARSGDPGDPLPELPEPGERGRLTIAEKVVERVAGHAVTQMDGVSAAPRRVLGVTVGEARADTEAAVTAQVDGSVGTVRATVAIAWPQPVRVVADRLRTVIRDDVALMTDVRISQVDLDVVSFAAATPRARRVR